ncbi:MAG: SMP-30/gluconolactonase/LRE family protein [Alphaproteobacteria bacterium]|nr:SMP-30/gluconolactonase/LRE family protein [Alphaproteobacteria bacterium]
MSLYPPPQDIQTTVYARLPDHLHKNARSAWADASKGGVKLNGFLEGPSFDRDGNLYLVDIPFGRILRLSADGADWSVIAEYDGEPNGLKIRNDGQIFIADYKNGIMQLDPATGEVTPYIARAKMESFKGCNDLVFAKDGSLYFTDQGLTGMHDPTGRVYRQNTDGRLECMIDTIPSPNGLVPNLDESLLYIAVTRANQVWRMPLPRDGGTFKVGVFIQLSGGLGGPDGMALDSSGNLAVCHAGNGSVWIFSELGEPLYRVRSCEGLFTTNCAFGGPDGKSLFITESDSNTVLRAELPTAGKTMYSHMN